MQKNYTTAEAATELGIKPRTVMRHIERGTLPATKRGRDYIITAKEIERFKTDRKRPGRPTKKLH